MTFSNVPTMTLFIQEAQERAPSAVMSTLVEKLRTELAEKEKKQRAMGRALADLKK